MNSFKQLIYTLTLTFLSFSLLAQEVESDEKYNIFTITKDDLRSLKAIPQSFYDLAQKPSEMDEQDWMMMYSLVSFTSLLLHKEEDFRQIVQENKNLQTIEVSTILEHFGNIKEMTYRMAATYLLGHLIKHEKLRQAALLSLATIASSDALVEVLKRSVGRSRPFLNEGNAEIHFLRGMESGDYKSFPSGHTATAFAVAGAIAEVYHDKPLIQFLSYLAATGVGLSRVHDDAHWASDTLLGAAISIFFAKTLAKRMGLNGESSQNLKVIPRVIFDRDEEGNKTWEFGVTVPIRSRRSRTAE